MYEILLLILIILFLYITGILYLVSHYKKKAIEFNDNMMRLAELYD